VRDALATTFASRADALKASWALGQLGRLVHDRTVDDDARAWFADRVEAARLEPALHRITVIEALNDLATAKAFLPIELSTRIAALADGTTPASRLGLPALATGARGPGARPRARRCVYDLCVRRLPYRRPRRPDRCPRLHLIAEDRPQRRVRTT
jgi:hypothetical protein